MPKKNSKKHTIKQKKLLKEITENLSSKGFTKSMTKMMLDAGYSQYSASQQANILAGLEEDIDPIINKLIEARTEAINRLPKTVSKAKYRDLVDGIDKMTKNIQLLSGKDTGRVNININDKKKKEIDELLDE